MHSIRIEWMIALVQLLTEPCAKGYDIKCPGPFQRIFRSEELCNSNQPFYTCLYNTFSLQYSEICTKKEYQSRKGRKVVFSPVINEIDCEDDRFQTIPFTTNSFTDCMFRKSQCNEEGQVIISNGSTFMDRTCRCNYNIGYVYVTQPKDKCSCVPSQEDCSCFLRHCKENEKLSADYDCVPESSSRSAVCGKIGDGVISPEETDTVYKILLQVSDSRTWSKQASIILIVVVIIYTVLIGFLFFGVPHVTSILLKSKLELSVKRKENEFMILNGDDVKIECNVKSYIPVRSVTWLKEINDEIIQITPTMEKYGMDFGKRPSLTIDNFDAGDQGKYRCIVRNAIGLRNELFGSCIIYMSRVGWLTRYVKVLQHIPAFHTEDMMYMTLHTYDIDSESKPTEYNVYIGGDIKMGCCDDQQKLKAVKWYKESDKRTELDLSDEQYSGGVPGDPSLTIKNTILENAGKYFCILIYDNEVTKTASFKLKIMPQVKIFQALLQHREDKTFIRPAICDIIDKHLEENNIVVITGREGTGKSKICLELASFYDEKDYRIMIVDLSKNDTIYTDIVDSLLIIDDQKYTSDSLNTCMKHLLPVLGERNIKVILTCRNLDLEIVRSVPEINELKSEVFIDINSCLTTEEKENMLRRYMEVYKIAKSPSFESNFRDPKILTDVSVKVTLHDDAFERIKNEEPWQGFPFCTSLFFSKRKLLHLGEKYFTNPPRYILNELKKLYDTAIEASYCIDTINDYCVLVYIMKNRNHQLDLKDSNLCSQLCEIYQAVFQLNYKPKPGSNDDQKISIEEALHRMSTKYLKCHEGIYEFIHPCLLKAVLLSSDSLVKYLLETGSLHEITEFVRSKDYTGLENELFINVGEKDHHLLCERLARHAFENHSSLQHVAQYIYTYWRSSDNELMNKIFSHIEFNLFHSLRLQPGDFQPLANDSVSENSIKVEDQVSFSDIIMLVNELTYKGKDPWIYGDGTSDFFILSGLVTASIGSYATNRDQTFSILLSEFQKRMHSKPFVKLWNNPLDIYGNTFFHYLMLFSQIKACQILSVIEERKNIFHIKNAKKFTPLDIAAYLGKEKVLKVLILKTNCTNKSEERRQLQRLAKIGKTEFYNENVKYKNYDRTIGHINKDDGANKKLSEKSQCKNADDEKEEMKKKRIHKNLLKKAFCRSKEKNNLSESESVGVLCFDEFVSTVVDLGEIEDYELTIELLSK